MKRQLQRLLCVGALLSIPTMVSAVAGWTSYAQIAELTPTVSGRFLVTLKVSGNPSGCRNKDTFYGDYGIPGSEQMFQTLLVAVEANKNVRVYVTGRCDSSGYAEISSVGVVP